MSNEGDGKGQEERKPSREGGVDARMERCMRDWKQDRVCWMNSIHGEVSMWVLGRLSTERPFQSLPRGRRWMWGQTSQSGQAGLQEQEGQEQGARIKKWEKEAKSKELGKVVIG